MLAWGGFRPRTSQLGGHPPVRHAAPNPPPDYTISLLEGQLEIKTDGAQLGGDPATTHHETPVQS